VHTFLIRLERKSETGDLLSMWLRSATPQARWGPRDSAMTFETIGDARRMARAAKIGGGWYVEPK
jgi:hypothetical protein